jgi:hypothetical protein
MRNAAAKLEANVERHDAAANLEAFAVAALAEAVAQIMMPEKVTCSRCRTEFTGTDCPLCSREARAERAFDAFMRTLAGSGVLGELLREHREKDHCKVCGACGEHEADCPEARRN